jgi:homoserine dehydrogenase
MRGKIMQTAAEFLAEIEKFLEKNSIAPATFGRLIMGDPSFIFELREGRAPSIDTCARISRIISNPQSAHLFYRPIKKAEK